MLSPSSPPLSRGTPPYKRAGGTSSFLLPSSSLPPLRLSMRNWRCFQLSHSPLSSLPLSSPSSLPPLTSARFKPNRWRSARNSVTDSSSLLRSERPAPLLPPLSRLPLSSFPPLPPTSPLSATLPVPLPAMVMGSPALLSRDMDRRKRSSSPPLCLLFLPCRGREGMGEAGGYTPSSSFPSSKKNSPLIPTGSATSPRGSAHAVPPLPLPPPEAGKSLCLSSAGRRGIFSPFNAIALSLATACLPSSVVAPSMGREDGEKGRVPLPLTGKEAEDEEDGEREVRLPPSLLLLSSSSSSSSSPSPPLR
mmetsp:Transcript_31201/g.81858  ORF Transcript_31201/g.81858 Transcript_31201/m.81858 type:complete len:306 (+) Transcript_31201:395-1312(+)